MLQHLKAWRFRLPSLVVGWLAFPVRHGHYSEFERSKRWIIGWTILVILLSALPPAGMASCGMTVGSVPPLIISTDYYDGFGLVFQDLGAGSIDAVVSSPNCVLANVATYASFPLAVTAIFWYPPIDPHEVSVYVVDTGLMVAYYPWFSSAAAEFTALDLTSGDLTLDVGWISGVRYYWLY